MNDFLIIDKKRTFLKNSSRIHELATPFAIGAFALTALTGILLVFNIHLGLVKPVHEWLRWLLITGAAFHIVVNWRPALRYFDRPVGRGFLFVFFVFICASLLPVGSRENRPHPADSITQALLQTPLATVVQVAGQSPENTIERLSAQGINPVSLRQTLQEIAVDNNKQAMDVLALIFKK
jgi:hypothetical protein